MVVVDHSIGKKRADKIKLNTHLTVQALYTVLLCSVLCVYDAVFDDARFLDAELHLGGKEFDHHISTAHRSTDKLHE